MRLLDRYLFRELLTPLAYILGGLVLLGSCFNLFGELEKLQERKLHLPDVLEYSLAITPEFLVLVLPITLLLALLYLCPALVPDARPFRAGRGQRLLDLIEPIDRAKLLRRQLALALGLADVARQAAHERLRLVEQPFGIGSGCWLWRRWGDVFLDAGRCLPLQPPFGVDGPLHPPTPCLAVLQRILGAGG